ncbi:uncharacterized protein [Haliotis asinina]|uniref:uncharacterized protein n=1 Tax=Haliotis asinina TaxID=109174 RepID=UPI0035319CFE
MVTIISSMSHSHMLKLNQEKSEVILFGPKNEFGDIGHLSTEGAAVQPSETVRNLGPAADDESSHSCQTANYHLRNIGKYWSYLSKNSTVKLDVAVILSWIDYCNIVFVNINKNQIKRFQDIQNSAARIIFDHITPLLKDLHWLPVVSHTDLKILLTAYKCFHDLVPSYLQELLQTYSPSTAL